MIIERRHWIRALEEKSTIFASLRVAKFSFDTMRSLSSQTGKKQKISGCRMMTNCGRILSSRWQLFELLC